MSYGDMVKINEVIHLENYSGGVLCGADIRSDSYWHKGGWCSTCRDIDDAIRAIEDDDDSHTPGLGMFKSADELEGLTIKPKERKR